MTPEEEVRAAIAHLKQVRKASWAGIAIVSTAVLDAQIEILQMSEDMGVVAGGEGTCALILAQAILKP